MTESGEAFVERMSVVNRMIQGGAAVFPALAAGLEDSDWLLVYAAIGRLVYDIEHQDSGAPQPRGEPAPTDAAQPVGSPNIPPLDLDADLAEHRFYRDGLIEECAKIAEDFECSLAGYPNDEAKDYYESGQADAGNWIADKIRALAIPSQEVKTP